MMSESKFGFEPEPPTIDPALEFAPTPVKRSEMRPIFEVDRAAKLAGFFGVNYRELFDDVLAAFELGIVEERGRGSLRPDEAQVS